MLKQSNRLLKKKDFDAVWKKGRSSYDKLIGVKVLANGLKNSRFGIMVGLKVSKKAVERNTVKRRIREIIQAETENIDSGLDVVINTLPAVNGQSYDVLRESVLGQFKRLKVITK